MSGFDSSDDEDQPTDTSPLQISWLNLTKYSGCCENLGISSLPGCKFKEIWRDLDHDIESLKENKVQNIFVLCTKGELVLYRVPQLLQTLESTGFSVHHHPFSDGSVPEISDLQEIVEKIIACSKQGDRPLVHCFGGLGRSALVAACLLLTLDQEMSENTALERVRELRGCRAIQSIKQYNFINDFRQMWSMGEGELGEARSVSR